MKNFYYRSIQAGMRIGINLLNWNTPKLLEGKDSSMLLPKIIKEETIEKVLIVTDEGLTEIGLFKPLLAGLDEEGIDYFIYNKTVPNPTIENIEEGRSLYIESNCQAIIAFGGGSAMDCAKGIGARIAKPNVSIPDMKGLFKIRKNLPPLFAVPTTAGTGSEGTLAAVVSNPITNEKYAIMDLSLIPAYAVLDCALTTGLPPHITATTGMDALTHAVEAYIGKSNTKETEKYAKDAIVLIFENLYTAYTQGDHLEARANMLKASYLAGLAFTRAYVGNVHAIAHTLGGSYSVPHGLANAVILPYVLDYYGETAYKRLAELADLIKITDEHHTIKEKAIKFTEEIKRLNSKMNIPEKLSVIEDHHIPKMVDRAFAEANPLYPVPKIFTKADFKFIYDEIKA